MSEQQPVPPAGWYPDPANATGRRWWDGTQWGVPGQPPAPIPKKRTQIRDVALIGALLTIGSPFIATSNESYAALWPLGLAAGLVLLVAALLMWVVKVGVSSAR